MNWRYLFPAPRRFSQQTTHLLQKWQQHPGKFLIHLAHGVLKQSLFYPIKHLNYVKYLMPLDEKSAQPVERGQNAFEPAIKIDEKFSSESAGIYPLFENYITDLNRDFDFDIAPKSYSAVSSSTQPIESCRKGLIPNFEIDQKSYSAVSSSSPITESNKVNRARDFEGVIYNVHLQENDRQAQLEIKDKEGNTPLLCAALNNALDTLKRLVEQGADINVKGGPMNRTALHHAVGKGSTEMVRYLINKGAFLDVRESAGNTPLIYDVLYNHFDALRLLVEKKANINAAGELERTALHHVAAGKGSPEMAHYLVNNGAFLELRDSEGETPLRLRVITNNIEILKCLVNKGANVDTISKKGHNPLQFAAGRGLVDIAHYLIDHGAQLELKDQEGDTPLSDAVHFNQLETVKLLVEKGANIQATRCNGCNALHVAVEKDLTEIAEYLIDKGIALELQNIEGDTPLMHAVLFGKLNAVKLLIGKGANINITRKNGCTARQAALSAGFTEIANFLTEKNAQLELQKINMALMDAVTNNQLYRVKSLVEKGANVNITRGNTGYSALHAAAANGLIDIAQYLIDNGAYLEFKDSHGYTPLLYAVLKKILKCLNY